MPIYDYVCPDCHQKFDTPSSYGQETATCPNCASTAQRSHSFTVPTVRFTGSGFYTTDNRRGDVPRDRNERTEG